MRKNLLRSTLLVLILVLAGCGSAVNPLLATVTKTSSAEGVKVELSGEATSAAGPMTFTGKGAMDLKGRRMQMETLMEMPALPGGSMKVDQVLDGTTMYMRMPMLKGQLPGGKEWMKIDMQKAGKAAGLDMSAMMQGGGSDPAAMLRWLEATDGVEELGTEAVRGVQATHYKAVVKTEDLGETLPEDQREAFEKNLDKLRELGMAEEVPMEVWVSDDDLLRRMTYEMTQTIPGAGEMTMKFTMELFDYGTNVEVNPPADGDTFDTTDVAGQGLQQQAGG